MKQQPLHEVLLQLASEEEGHRPPVLLTGPIAASGPLLCDCVRSSLGPGETDAWEARRSSSLGARTMPT